MSAVTARSDFNKMMNLIKLFCCWKWEESSPSMLNKWISSNFSNWCKIIKAHVKVCLRRCPFTACALVLNHLREKERSLDISYRCMICLQSTLRLIRMLWHFSICAMNQNLTWKLCVWRQLVGCNLWNFPRACHIIILVRSRRTQTIPPTLPTCIRRNFVNFVISLSSTAF